MMPQRSTVPSYSRAFILVNMKKLALIVLITSFALTSWAQWSQIGTDLDGSNSFSRAGRTVSLSGDGSTVAYTELSGAFPSVYVFKDIAGTWVQAGNQLSGAIAASTFGDGLSLNHDGTILAIGEPNTISGEVQVFKLIGGVWVQQGNSINGEFTQDESGGAVSLSSDGLTVAIGAIGNDANGNNSGHVRVHKFISGSWVKQGGDIDGEAANDRSGGSVSLSSDSLIVAIGAIQNNGNGIRRGHVRVYKLVSGSWVQQGGDINGESSDDEFGASVGISSDGLTLVVGAPRNGPLGNSYGHIRVFKFIGGSWVQQGTDIDGTQNNERLGVSVGISRDGLTFVAGASGANVNGAARVYRDVGGVWTQSGADIPGVGFGDGFGRVVSISSDGFKVAAGAINFDGTGQNSGHVRVFQCLPSTSSFSVVVCPGYTVPSGDSTYTSSQIVMDTILNSCGADSVMTINITIGDTVRPTIICPADTTIFTDAGLCTSTAGIGMSTATDNCSSFVTITSNAPAIFPQGNTVVTWTATDSSGNAITCDQLITVMDGEAPTISNCPSEVNIVASDTGCNGTAFWTVPTVSDNCSVANLSSTHNSGSSFPFGTTVVTYTATDSTGNTSTCSFNVIVTNDMMIVNDSVQQPLCKDDLNGQVFVTVTGGTPSYTYDWDNDGTGDNDDIEDLNGLGDGTFSVTVTDANGCTAMQSATLTEPAQLMASTVVDSNISCFGFSDGGATVSGTSGTMPYTYAWSNLATSASITGVVAGTHSVTITDANGCTSTNDVILTQDTEVLLPTLSSTDLACHSSQTQGFVQGGSVDAFGVTGGTSPYTYSWSDGSTGSFIGALPGTYTVTVTDANGCTDVDSALVSEPDSLVLVLLGVGSPNCHGGQGSACVQASGGTQPYFFGGDVISFGGSVDACNNLVAGNYFASVADATCGFVVTVPFTITEPDVLVSVAAVDSNVSCFSLSDGGATASATGGTAPYTYAWSNLATTASITGLAPGTYSVTVTDATFCIDSTSVTISEPTAISANAVAAPVSCTGDGDGEIALTVSGGTPGAGYTYLWSSNSTMEDLNGLSGGIYTVTVTDANGCTDTTSAQVFESAALLSLSSTATDVSCHGDSDGAVNLTVSGGQTNYSYSWSNNASTEDLLMVGGNTYTVTVTDAFGCQKTKTETVSEPAIFNPGGISSN